MCRLPHTCTITPSSLITVTKQERWYAVRGQKFDQRRYYTKGCTVRPAETSSYILKLKTAWSIVVSQYTRVTDYRQTDRWWRRQTTHCDKAELYNAISILGLKINFSIIARPSTYYWFMYYTYVYIFSVRSICLLFTIYCRGLRCSPSGQLCCLNWCYTCTLHVHVSRYYQNEWYFQFLINK